MKSQPEIIKIRTIKTLYGNQCNQGTLHQVWHHQDQPHNTAVVAQINKEVVI